MRIARVQTGLLFCASLTAALSALRADDATDKDRHRPQGQWELIAMEMQGAQVSLPAEHRLSIEGDKAKLKIGKQTLVSRWNLAEGSQGGRRNISLRRFEGKNVPLHLRTRGRHSEDLRRRTRLGAA